MKINLKNNKFLAFLSVGVIVLIFALVLSNRLLGQKTAQQVESPSPTESEYPVDKVNDGVYTNYEYGFRFEYPEEVFSKQSSLSRFEEAGITSQEWFYSAARNGLAMQVEIRDINKLNKYMSYFDEMSGFEVGESLGVAETNYRQKLGELNKDSTYGIIHYREIDHSTEEKLVVYAYVAAWREEDVLIEISISSDSKDTLEKNKEIFDNIEDSIELFGAKN